MTAKAHKQGIAWWKWVLLPLMLAVTAQCYFWAGSFQGFQMPEAMRIVFWHVPQAILSLVWYGVAAFYGYRYLASRDLFDDTRSSVAAEIALLVTILAAASGAIFAYVQWGAAWSWDIKQVGITLLMSLYLAYFVLRASISEPRTRASLSAAYAIFGVFAAVFCYYVLPRFVDTLHPGTDVIRSGMDAAYRTTFWMSVLGFFGFTLWSYQLKLRVERVADALAARASSPATADERLEPVRRQPVAEPVGRTGGD